MRRPQAGGNEELGVICDSKARSGTRAEFERQAGKIEAEVKKMLDRHREADDRALEANSAEKENQRIERLQKDAAQLREWL